MRKLSTTTLIVSLALGLAACGGGSSGGGTPTTPTSSAPALANSTAGKAAATTQIKANWATFFTTGTPQATAIGLLENGSQLGPAITLATKVAKKSKLTERAEATKVDFTDPTHANVTYTLYGNGKKLITDGTGIAVLQDGTWRVAQNTFCTLVDLGASQYGFKNPPGC